MRIINKIIIGYFIFALPLLMITWFLFPSAMRTETSVGSPLLDYVNTVTGGMLAIWIITALYIAVSLIFSSSFRERLLTKIARMKERDEREEMIVGRAGRSVFLFNLALLICIFMLNLVQVDISKLPPEKTLPGREHNLHIRLNFEPLVSRAADAVRPQMDYGKSIFKYSFPITVSGVLMILIVINIGAFYVYARRAG